MRAPRLVPMLAGALLGLGPAASADETLRLADGSVVTGQVARRSPEELVLRTPYGELVVPTADLVPDAPADPDRLQALQDEAGAALEAGDFQAAAAHLEALLALVPDDGAARYDLACARALLGQTPAALEALERAVAAGFVDFARLASDPALEPLRREPRYARLLADAPRWRERAAASATARVLAELRARGCEARYEVVVDPGGVVYLHAGSAARLAAVRERLDAFRRRARRDLLGAELPGPLHVVLLTPGDAPALLEEGAGGLYSADTNVLYTDEEEGPAPDGASVLLHELTHALHFADQAARGQAHPIWLVEGLASLLEAADVVDDRLVPRPEARLGELQEAVARGRALPWETLTRLDQPAFLADADLAYAQARHVLLYLSERGLLRRFYDDYVEPASFEADPSGLEALEVALGRPIEEVERDWARWVLARR
jgi:hypothetical protein